jgi:hypothetical protein
MESQARPKMQGFGMRAMEMKFAGLSKISDEKREIDLFLAEFTCSEQTLKDNDMFLLCETFDLLRTETFEDQLLKPELKKKLSSFNSFVKKEILAELSKPQ